MARLRLLLLGLSMFVLVWADGWIPSHVSAQVRPGLPQDGFALAERGQGGLSRAARELVQKLKAAEKSVKEGKPSDAAWLIHQLLTQPQDGFFPSDEGIASGQYISLKREAAKLLHNAPTEIRDSYERQYGAEARDKLDRARALQDPLLAQEVTQHSLQTNAGAEACYWLACQSMDQADYFTAAQYLNRLKALDTANRFEPRLSLRLGLCWHRMGMTGKALACIQDVQKRSREPLEIATHTLKKDATDEQIRAWLKLISNGPESRSRPENVGWLMARGTADRNPHAQSSPPTARPLWSLRTSAWMMLNRKSLKPETVDVSPQLNSLKIVHSDAALTPLPSTIPLIVNNLVIMRFSDHIAAMDLRTGEEVWTTFERDRNFHELHDKIDLADKIANRANSTTPEYRSGFKILLRQRVWEDLTYGTLSSNGDNVFAIEDLGFAKPIDFENAARKSVLYGLKDYNRLCAYDVHSGMLRWELGGPNSSIKLDQAGTFFLGPPLPIEHQLYCLVENQGFVQLLVLDAKTGAELWSQDLAQANERLLLTPYRARAGLTPAMSNELLVCSTSAGYIVAVDTGTRSLAWAYQYATPTQNPRNGNLFFMGGRVRVSNGADLVDFNPDRPAITNEWQDGSPTLTDTHVILTPRDSNELHCLLLKDGSLQWKAPRGEGQYVACVRDGVVFVVNKHSVEALHVGDGKPAWPAPVPITNQTGRGVATSTHLLLPLVNGQVVSIDLKTAVKVYSRVRAADQEPLGNLVPGPGLIVSQTPSELSAFRTLESIHPEALQRLAANPRDAEALAQRGEYLLSVSQTDAGQADLRESLRIKPSAGAQFLLFESLLEGLQSNFATHRQGALEAEKLAHTTTQKSMLYRVWVEGLRKLGESQSAFQLLEKLGNADMGRPGMERVDGLHSIRRDYWMRYELRQIIDNSSPADQQRFLAHFKARLDQAKGSKNDEDLRRLSHLLGWGSIADQTRLALAERLATKDYSLEAEQLLSSLRQHADPKISGKALALMITEMIKLERGGEAASLIEELERTHADIICHANKTGQQLAAEWRKTVPMGIGSFEDWPTGRVEMTRDVLEKGDVRNYWEIPIEGDRGPFYSDIQLRFESGSEKFLGLSGWATPRFAIPWSELGPLYNPQSFNSQIKNHIILLGTAANVVAIDSLTTGKTIRAQQIWSTPLSDRPSSDATQSFQPARARPGIGRLRFADRSQNPIGMVGAVQDDSLCVIRGRHLVLLDILTGETLWKRTDMVPGSEVFGDAETIFVIAPPSVIESGPVAKKIRRADGAIIGESPVPGAINRIHCQGKYVLSLTPDRKTPGSFLLKLDDVSLGATVWELTYNAAIQLSLVGNSELAVLEQSGMLTHLRLVDGKPLWTRQLLPSVRRRDFAVIAEEKRLLILRDESQPPNFPQQVMAINPTQSTLMYGQVDCVDRATGELLWSHRIEGYGLDLTAPNSSPFWFFAARAVSPQIKLTEIRMLALDKRTGRVALQASEGIYGQSFEFGIDPKERLVDITLIGSQHQQPVRFRLKLTGEAITTAPAVPTMPPAEPEKPPEPPVDEK